MDYKKNSMGFHAATPLIVTDGLTFLVDAGDGNSYGGSGSTWTDMIGGKNGTIYNAPFDSSNYGSFDFNGTTSNVEFTNSSDFDPGTGDFSAAVWFKCDDPTDLNYLLSSGNYNSPTPGWTMWISDSNISVRCKAGSSYGTSQRASMLKSFSDTGWNYLTMVIDRTNDLIIGYLNGSTSGFAVGGGPNNQDMSGFGSIASGENLRIGDNTATFAFYTHDGHIASVKMYKGKALTAAEVLQNYNAGKARFGL